jgi:Escherichia/Staphylococcus phage prohead protease
MADRITFSTKTSVEGNTLTARAHLFGKRALVGNRYIEFAKGAFTAALSRADVDVRAFWNHETSLLLGRQSAGTVRVSEDEEGLVYEVDLPDTSYAADLKALIARGDVTESSFGILPDKYALIKAPDGKTVQRHTSVAELFDVSPVSIPAFVGTNLQLHSRSLDGETVRGQLVKARHRARTQEKTGNE